MEKSQVQYPRDQQTVTTATVTGRAPPRGSFRRSATAGTGLDSDATIPTPNLPTKISPAKIR